MSTHGHPTPHAQGQAATEAHDSHASVATYVRVALILTAVTALEVGVIYIRLLTPIVVPLLLVMATAKFVLVVMFFMHLRFDNRMLRIIFVSGLILAGFVYMLVLFKVGNPEWRPIIAGYVGLLLTLWILDLRGRLGVQDATKVEVVGLYWHFVDIVWIIIFTVIYLIP